MNTRTMLAFGSIALAAACICLGLIVALVRTPAKAHGWYDADCCHDQDCAVVDSAISESAIAGYDLLVPTLPRLIVTTKHGTAVVPHDMQRRQSPDGRLHACIRQGKLICIYMPQSW